MGQVVVAVGVVAVVGGQDGRPDAPGDLDQLGVGLVLGRQTVILQLDEEVVPPEDVLQAPGLGQRPGLVTPHERLEHVAPEAAGGGDEAVVVALQQLPVQAGLVVVALQEGQAGQLDQVAVALVGLGQQGQVVVELPAAFGLAAGVVQPAPARRPLGPMVVGHVGLGAEDRLDALGLAGPVEVQDPVHVPVVGDPEGRLPVRRRGGHQLLDPGRAVQHRVLGVDVEVGERVAHEAASCEAMVLTMRAGRAMGWARRVTRVCFGGYHRARGRPSGPPPEP